MVHVLILFECVLLMIIGLDQFVRMSTLDGAQPATTRGIESSADAQSSSMGPAIVTMAAAAGQDIMSGAPELAIRSVLPGPVRGEALSQPPLQEPDVLASSSGAMREADRRAIARDLLGVVYDRVLPIQPPEVAASNADFDGTNAPLPRPAKANRPRTPQQHANVLVTPPVARPAGLADVPQAASVPISKLSPATRSNTSEDVAPNSAKIAEVQHLLGQLGYKIGDIDGVFGKRTEIAIRSFQQHLGGIVDGRISEGLVARLRRAVGKEGDAEPSMARRSGYALPRQPRDGGWLGSVVAGYQRFVGHNFNSIAQPRELQSYCKLQSDTWVFDEGSRRFLHCAEVTASK